MPQGVVTLPVISSFSGKNDKYDEEEDGCEGNVTIIHVEGQAERQCVVRSDARHMMRSKDKKNGERTVYEA